MATNGKVPVGEVAELFGGGTPLRSKSEFFGGGIPWVTPSDLPAIGVIASLGDTENTLTQAGLHQSSAKLLPPRTVLFSSRATIGKIAVADRSFSTNQGFINFVPDPMRLDEWYLAFYLLHALPEIKRLCGETTFKEVPRTKMRDFGIPDVPVKEQRRVVGRIKECLSRVEEMQRLREEAEADARTLLDALIDDFVGEANGARVRLGEVTSIPSVLVDPRKPQYSSLLHIGGANITSGTGELVDLKTAADEKLISGKYVFTPEDVIYSKIRPKLRKVVRPNFTGLCSADSYPLRPDSSELTRDYLFYVLLSRALTEYAVRGSNRAGIPKVNREHLLKFEFPLPKTEEQSRVTKKLNAMWRSTRELRDELAAGNKEEDAFRKAILREAFAGNL